MPLDSDYDEIYLELSKPQKSFNKNNKENKNGKYTTKHIRIQNNLFISKIF